MLELVGDNEELRCTDHPEYDGENLPKNPCPYCLVVYVDVKSDRNLPEKWVKRISGWIEHKMQSQVFNA